MKAGAALLVAAAAVVAAGPAAATTVQVRVLNVASDAGVVRVGICPRSYFLKRTCPYVAKAPARRGVVVVTVPDVPEGVYAAQAFHDDNDSGDITRNFLGIPTEGIGFSRNAPFRFGPPRFDDAAYSISGALVTLDITLKFEP